MAQSEEIALRFSSFQPKLGIILKKAVQALDGNAGLVSLWDDSRATFTHTATFGLTPEALDELRPLLEQLSVELLAKIEADGSSPLLIHNAGYSSNPVRRRQESILTLPLKVEDKIIGLMYILRPQGREGFVSRDRRLLQAFAEHAAIAIENARLAHELAEEKGKMESIIHYSADGIMTLDRGRRIVEFNPAMERLTGWKREEVLHKRCQEVMNLCDNSGALVCDTSCPIVKAMLRDESVYEIEGNITTKENQHPYVAMTYSIVRGRDNQPILAVVNCRDISRLREVENLRSTFLSVITHELQTPIAIIKSYANTMLRDDVCWERETTTESFAIIEEESNRLSSLVNNLLYASRIEAGGVELRLRYVHFPSLVRKVSQRLEPQLTNHDLCIDFPQDFPPVLADEERMESVFFNLLDNSIKYSPRGGAISVRGEVRNQEVTITVEDQGIGIPARDLDKVFEKFHRVDSGLTRESQGAGLGLYICRSIIKAHGGDINAESGVGRGSRFTFSLPLERAEDDHFE